MLVKLAVRCCGDTTSFDWNRLVLIRSVLLRTATSTRSWLVEDSSESRYYAQSLILESIQNNT